MLCTVDIKAKPIQNLVVTIYVSTRILMNFTTSYNSVGKSSALYDNTNFECKARLTQTCQATTFCQDAARTTTTSRFFRRRQSPRWFEKTNMQMKGSWWCLGHDGDTSGTDFTLGKSSLRQC